MNEKKNKTKQQKIIQRILTVLIAVLLIAAGWLLFHEYAERRDHQRLQNELRELYTEPPSPTPEPEPSITLPAATPTPTVIPETQLPAEPTLPRILPQFDELLAINPDVVGWISIPGTAVDYPVLQTEDNVYYLDHDIYGETSRAGTLFMDYRMLLDGTDRHQIIYGHHTRDGSMFTSLMDYKDESFFNANRLIYLDQLFEKQTWEIFSAYVTSTDFYYIETRFSGDEDWLAFMEMVQDRSKFNTEVTLSADDQMLTLSTCTYEFDDARFVVHARLVRDTQEDQDARSIRTIE